MWEEYDNVYFVDDGKLYSTQQNVDLLLSLSNIKKNKTQTIKFSENIDEWKTIMKSRLKNTSRWLSNIDEYCKELAICKNTGNELYNHGLFNAAKGMYASFFVGPFAKPYHHLMDFDYKWENVKGIQDTETAKLCNNISLCLLKEKKINLVIAWCRKALYFNPNYEKVNKRIINLTK